MNFSCSIASIIALLVLQSHGSAETTGNLKSFLKTHCVSCHSGQSPEAKLDLENLSVDLNDRRTFERWALVHDRTAKGEMPPKSENQPSAEERAGAATKLATALTNAESKAREGIGRTVLRRLNRTEYENTLHDLLGIDEPLKGILPEDSSLDGFDTVADGLRLSPLHMEKYLEAAERALEIASQFTRRPETKKQRFPYKEQEGVRKHLDQEKRPTLGETERAIVLYTDASYITKVYGLNIGTTGNYRIRTAASGYNTKKPVVLRLYAGNYRNGTKKLLGYYDLQPDVVRETEAIVRLEEGEYLFPAPDDLETGPDGKSIYSVGAKDYPGSGVALEWIEVEGPLVDEWPPAATRKLFADLPLKETDDAVKRKWDRKAIAYRIDTADHAADAGKVITRFAERAFRRPLETGEADRFVFLAHTAIESGETFEDAVRIAMRAILSSPQFLLFSERPGKLDDFALASRLSYFLTSSAPDAELLRLAAAGKLSDPAELRKQTDRLLDSPKSSRFISNFVGQWFDLRGLDATAPDKRLYPEFDELLRDAIERETLQFFAVLLRSDSGVKNLIDSDFAILNRRLAEHYGIEGVQGEEMRRVSITPDTHRGGLLTQASILKETANGTVTSPVIRGAWVMTRLLGEPPPAPPADVGAIEPDTRGATTIREQLAKHRTLETCASCHRSIDPPGFALENYDVIGGYRERYRTLEKGDRPTKKLGGRPIHEYRLGLPVDASGETSDGRPFADLAEFKQWLLLRERRIARNTAERLMVYASGASLGFSDRAEIEKIVNAAQAKKYGFRTLVHETVQSKLFQSK